MIESDEEDQNFVNQSTLELPDSLVKLLITRYETGGDCITAKEAHELGHKWGVLPSLIEIWFTERRKQYFQNFQPFRSSAGGLQHEKRTIYLESKYQQHQYVDKDQALEIANNTGMSVSRVKIWFQNRRAKNYRRKKRADLKRV